MTTVNNSPQIPRESPTISDQSNLLLITKSHNKHTIAATPEMAQKLNKYTRSIHGPPLLFTFIPNVCKRLKIKAY